MTKIIGAMGDFLPRKRNHYTKPNSLIAQLSAAVAAGTGLMKVLSAEEMQELRTEIAGFGISDQRKDELIHFLDAIAISYIDQAHGFHATQLSLSSRANYAFNGAKTHANLSKSEKSELVDLQKEGAINTESPEGQFAP